MALINFAGIASGIDSSALIQALIEQQRSARITPFENRISSLTETNDSLGKLKELLSNLQTAASGFRTLNGGVVAKNVTSSSEPILTATASNAAQVGSYDIDISQRASNATFSFDDRFSSATDAINSSISDASTQRNVSFQVGQGSNAETVDITVSSTTSAQDFVDEFNSQSSSATASLVNTGTASTPSYAIVVNSNNEGEDLGSIQLLAVGSEITSAGSGAFTSSTLDQATNLQFTVDGIAGTIERSSNTVNDLFDGVSFTAQGTGSATISIANDASASSASVKDFVDAYNDLVNYISEGNSITRDEGGSEITNIFGALTSTSIDENALSSIKSVFASSSLSDGQTRILADLGITTQRDGTLSFNEDTFTQALQDDAGGVGNLLANVGESLGAVDGTIAQFVRFNGLIPSAISSNQNEISTLQSRISDIESSLAKQEQSLTARFSRLEALIGQMQNAQNVLASILP